MKPMEAWSIISGNLAQLYKMLKTPCFRGYVPADTEAEVIAFKALQELQERTDPKTLSIEELRQLTGDWVWVEAEATPERRSGWGYVCGQDGLTVSLIIEFNGFWEGSPICHLNLELKDYEMSWRAFRHKPQVLEQEAIGGRLL